VLSHHAVIATYIPYVFYGLIRWRPCNNGCSAQTVVRTAESVGIPILHLIIPVWGRSVKEKSFFVAKIFKTLRSNDLRSMSIIFPLKHHFWGPKFGNPPSPSILCVLPDVLAGDLMGGIVTLVILEAKVAKKVPIWAKKVLDTTYF
jgi:hypothetical protein